MSPTERDPRKDPRPGDIVSQGRIFNGKRESIRTVSDRVHNRLAYRIGDKRRSCYVSTWQEWARGAEVVTKGKP